MESWIGCGMFDEKRNAGGIFDGSGMLVECSMEAECWWNVRWNGMLLECSISFAERLKEYSVQAVVEPYARCCSMFKIGVLKGFSSVEVDLPEAAGTSA